MLSELSIEHKKLSARLRMLNQAFDRHLLNYHQKSRSERFNSQEGLISLLWQSWCHFCRSTIVASVQGAVTSSGMHTASPYASCSEAEISYLSKSFSLGQSVNFVKPIKNMRSEPTWGDVSKIGLIISGLSLSNAGQLSAAFGVSKSIADLQRCRNACAHLNIETMSDVSSLSVRYVATHVNHPSDISYWVVPDTQDYLWRYWIEEIDLIAELAIK